jgi:hypothetical protein
MHPTHSVIPFISQSLKLLQGQPIDLVTIWSLMDDGGNGIAKLAIRILSVIANSGACECTFSDFGIILTKIRNVLSVEKVHKTNTVRMDIRRRHTALGLVPKQGKQKLGNDDDEPQDPEAEADEECDLTFTTLARRLVDMAAADTNNDNDDDTTASASCSVPHQRRPCRTQIPLSELFNYDIPDNGLDFYWKEGLKNLEGQSEQFEQLHNEQNAVPPSGSKNNVPPVPADTSSII